ncbi:hypothetical protein HELRODRAFT_84823, partial [Helobdella robusta]|uniref:Fatty acyl-CoA reductase n=1 Tax=Helobdella robusta TaxID=6412 RepID=T1G5P2_HELRO
SKMSNIVDFYKDRTLFITGVTGFMGKVLLEKLLRSCPGLKKVYLLMRPKKGHDIRTRLNQLIESKLFDDIRENMLNVHEKVIPVAGDIMEPKLGLSEEEEKILIEEVSIVFHSAATVRFDEPLKMSVQLNIIGVNRILDLCKKMQHLDALIHISTAYANCDRHLISEKIYQPPITASKIVSAMEWMDDEVVQALTPKIIQPRPNTYTFTKAIAEHLIAEKSENLPVAIVRPSIVGASWQEPLQGWVDNFNGPSGLLVAIGKGILRVMMGNNSACADLVPVDMAVNLIIASAWSTATYGHNGLQIFNCTTGLQNRLTWGQIEKASMDCFSRNPVDVPVRLPNPKFTLNRTYYLLQRWFDHFLPAWFMDIGLKLCGQKPILMRLQRRLWKSVSCMEFFTSHEWKFEDDNVRKLYANMSERDQKDFNFDVKQIHWPTYLENYCLGVKRFVLKEDMKNLLKARKAFYRLVGWLAGWLAGWLIG